MTRDEEVAANAVKGEPVCYLCGVRIDQNMVDQTHPLFGTIDHVKPRSKSGPDAQWNRLPAHRICNLTKANLDLSVSLMDRCHAIVLAMPASVRLLEGMTKSQHKRVPLLRMLAVNAIIKADEEALKRDTSVTQLA